MQYLSDLYALHNLESIVRCLSKDLQRRLAGEADEIRKENIGANFEDLIDFWEAGAEGQRSLWSIYEEHWQKWLSEYSHSRWTVKISR